jgi:hypothetical protein
MAGGNPFMPPGANPGGPVPQPGVGQGPGGQSASSAGPNRGRLSEVGRAPFNGAGASILAPGGPPTPSRGGNATAPPSKQGQPFADIHANLKQARAQYNDVKKAGEVLDHLRTELDGLMEMGDMVRPEHVVEAAGRLVGHGIGASQLAQIMSDMPATGGEGLASWIRMHDMTITDAEQKVALETRYLQHNLGTAAVSAMAATHLESRMQEPRGSSMASPPDASMQAPPEEGNQLGAAPMSGQPPLAG